MASNGASKHTLRWGILAPGGIAQSFVGDLLLDPATRGVTDVAHTVVAVASASGKQKADDFVAKMYSKPQLQQQAEQIRTYGSYDELIADANVEIIYVASPQSHHYQHVRSCLSGGKHVLCEKPLTINAKQTQKLVDLARQNRLFFMEARWTKFFDIFKDIQKLVNHDHVLGNVFRVASDFGQVLPEDHRLFRAELGGGAALDLGIYPLTWISALLWDHPRNAHTPPRIAASMRINPKYNIDEDTTAALYFDKIGATGLITTNLRVNFHRPAYHTIIQGDKGDLLVHGDFTSTPLAYTLALHGQKPLRHEPHLPGHGMMWEADECARCIAHGKLESDTVSHQESIFAMQVLDEIRRQGGLVFPGSLEDAD